MSTDVVYTAVQDFLKANWTQTALYWENDPADPPTRAPYVYVEISGNTYDQVSIGTGIASNDRWREEGHVWLHVFVPTGSGSLAARQLATALTGLFQGRQLEPLIEFRDMSVGLGQPGSDDGNWWGISVSVEWIRG